MEHLALDDAFTCISCIVVKIVLGVVCKIDDGLVRALPHSREERTHVFPKGRFNNNDWHFDNTGCDACKEMDFTFDK